MYFNDKCYILFTHSSNCVQTNQNFAQIMKKIARALNATPATFRNSGDRVFLHTMTDSVFRFVLQFLALLTEAKPGLL